LTTGGDQINNPYLDDGQDPVMSECTLADERFVQSSYTNFYKARQSQNETNGAVNFVNNNHPPNTAKQVDGQINA